MYEFLNNKDFLKARRDKQYFIFRNVIKENLTWEEVIQDIDQSLEKKYEIKTRFKFGIVTHNAAEHITKVDNFLNAIHKLDPLLNKTAHIYTSLSSQTRDGELHWDRSDVWYWQTIGNAEVELANNIEEGSITHRLQPGDVIYFPEGMHHKVISLTPRVGVSLGLDRDGLN
jgi:hypothetical protein